MRSIPRELMQRVQEELERLSELARVLNEAADEADTYYDEKSERWQESDKGSEYSEWKHTIRWIAEEVDNLSERLGELPTRPGE